MTRLYADLYFYKTMVMGDQKSIGFLFVCLFCCGFFLYFHVLTWQNVLWIWRGSNLHWSVESQPSGNLPLLPSVVLVKASKHKPYCPITCFMWLWPLNEILQAESLSLSLVGTLSPHAPLKNWHSGVQSYLLKCLNWIMWTLHPLGYEQVRFCSALGSAWELVTKVMWFWQL